MSNAIEKCLDKKVAIAFSGGLDSSTIATVAKKKCEVALITVGMKDSEDLISARKVAKELDLQLNEIEVDSKILFEDYKKMWKLMPGTLVDMELMCAIYEVCKKAKELGCEIVLFGSGAEELFVGYHKYYCAIEEGKDLDEILKKEVQTLPNRDIFRAKKVAEYCKINARFPFMNQDLIDAVFMIEAKDRIGPIEMKKPLLRKIAQKLNVPTHAVQRQKKAMQYGSNIHKTIMQMARDKKVSAWEPRAPFVYDQLKSDKD